jgi:hypothetical protein
VRWGAVVLVDTRRISDAFAPLDYFENLRAPMIFQVKPLTW